ncbi:MAG TPA: histidine kinase [Geminicoccaceae bacterium]|nr:histidine kinase [Geminicoccaceae bacterium]
MAWLDAFRNRTERTIAVARAVLGLAALLAIWLDPTQPTGAQALTYGLLGVYALYAMGLAVALWRARLPQRDAGLAAHIVDLVAFTCFMYLTEGPTSPFFVFFGFSLIAATLRWSWRGTLATAGFALAVIGGFVALATLSTLPLDLEPHRVVTRAAWLAVAAMMLAVMASHQDRLRAVLWGLALRPGVVHSGAEPIDARALARLGDLFGVRRVLLASSEPEEPWLDLALLQDGELAASREPPDRFEPLLDPALVGRAFLSLDAGRADRTLLWSPEGLVPWRGRPLHAELCRRFAIRSVVALPVPTAEGEAPLLFLLDRSDLTSDDLLLGEVAAAQLGAVLDQARLVRRLQAAAAAEARLRVARDLHDGVLQSLTGTALQLQSLGGLLERSPAEAGRRLAAIQQALAREQRELRGFIELLRPSDAALPGGLLPVDAALRPLTERLAEQWGLAVGCTVEPADLRVEGPLVIELSRLLTEAVANACRHGAARAVEVRVSREGETLRLKMRNDGRAFAFRGRLGMAELARRGLGPRSLRERVAALRGTLGIDSAESAVVLDIALPLGRQEARA